MRPPRTVGLSFAILASVMLFTLLPLLQIAVVVLVQYRLSTTEIPLPSGEDSVAPFATGAELTSLTQADLIFQIGSSLVFLIIALLAWRGRPRWIRQVMIGSVLLLLIVSAIATFNTLGAPSIISTGIDSGISAGRSLAVGRLMISGLVALYVLWYMNRGPARAFYRGAYLQRNEQVHETNTN